MRRPSEFKRVIKKLKGLYGQPQPPALTDPFQLIIFENIAYLVDDSRRALTFETLKKQVGLKPTQIAAAPIEQLVEICKLGGIHPELRAQRLKEAAQIVLNEFQGELATVLGWPSAKAIKAVKQFPSIGEPGAEKILLFGGSYPVLALESNGLRVCVRLGFGEEKKSYSATYKSVRESLGELGDDYDFLIGAHHLLRRHGKEICVRSNPRCDQCVLRKMCRFYQSNK